MGYLFCLVSICLNCHFFVMFRLADVYCPILILHDRDDEIISFELGKKVSVKMRSSM